MVFPEFRWVKTAGAVTQVMVLSKPNPKYCIAMVSGESDSKIKEKRFESKFSTFENQIAIPEFIF